jgi:hypothetical protein
MITDEQNMAVIKRIRDRAYEIMKFVAPMTMKCGPAETILAMDFARRQMEEIFRMSYPPEVVDQGLAHIHHLAEALSDAETMVMTDRLKDSPISDKLKDLMTKAGLDTSFLDK